MSERVKCAACKDYFEWDQDVVEVKDNYYHRDCVTLYVKEYVAYVDDEYLGETENEDGQMACSVLADGQYIDVDEDQEESQ